MKTMVKNNVRQALRKSAQNGNPHEMTTFNSIICHLSSGSIKPLRKFYQY